MVGIEELNSDQNFSLYPNPTVDGTIMISLDKSVTQGSLIVTDLLGKRVLSIDINNTTNMELTINNSGMYFVNLFSNGQFVNSQKVIVE